MEKFLSLNILCYLLSEGRNNPITYGTLLVSTINFLKINCIFLFIKTILRISAIRFCRCKNLRLSIFFS